MSLTINKAFKALSALHKSRANTVPFMKGSPAIGKSAIVRELAKSLNLEVIDVRLSQCEPSDLLGIPVINKETNQSSYAPNTMFPLENTPKPEGKDGWVLFFDELNSAGKHIQAAAYKIINEKEVALEKLHKDVFIVCAGNKDTDDAITEKMGSAIRSRLVNLEVDLDNQETLEFMSRSNFHPFVQEFLLTNKDFMYNFNPDGDSYQNGDTFASPRTWEMVSSFLKTNNINTAKQLDDKENLFFRDLIIGSVGIEAGNAFISFIKTSKAIANANDILTGKTFDLPTKLDHQIILVKRIANQLKHDVIENATSSDTKFLDTKLANLAKYFDKNEKSDKAFNIENKATLYREINMIPENKDVEKIKEKDTTKFNFRLISKLNEKHFPEVRKVILDLT